MAVAKMKARAKMQLIKEERKQLPLTASKFGGVVSTGFCKMKARAKMQLIKEERAQQLPLTASKFGGVMSLTVLAK